MVSPWALFASDLFGTTMPTPNFSIYHDDGVTLREEVVEQRKSDVVNIYEKLNSSILLSYILKNSWPIIFKRESMLEIAESDPIKDINDVNPYDPEYTDYIKDMGGHVLVTYDQFSDDIRFELCTESYGDEVISRGDAIGFFSIRRPWNIQGWGNDVYKRQFPYSEKENDESN